MGFYCYVVYRYICSFRGIVIKLGEILRIRIGFLKNSLSFGSGFGMI